MADENQESGLNFDLPKHRSSVIKVIGVGGGGSNAVNHMKEMGIKGVDFMICNTDAQALEHSLVENRIQLGANLTEGLGAGANPDVGRDAAQESLEEIREVLKNNTRMVFITAGMGGGTGTGAAPVIAKLAREMNILTVGIVTKPFHFEGKIRAQQAQIGIEELRQHVDSLVVINNDKLREVYGNLTFRSGFAKADEVLATAAKGIAEVITYHYTTNIDLRDVRTVLENSGTAIMGSSSAKGPNREKLAVKQALDSPLLNDNHINGAKNVLLLIVSGSGDQEITMDEMGVINEHIQDEAGGNANVILGVGIDENLKDAISVTVIATGFPTKQRDIITGRTPDKIVHPLEEDQPIEKGIFERPFKAIDGAEKKAKQRPNEPDLFSGIANKSATVHDLYEDEEDDFEITSEVIVASTEAGINEKTEMPSDEVAAVEDEIEHETTFEIEEDEEVVFEEKNTSDPELQEDEDDDFEYSLDEMEVDAATKKLAETHGENEVTFDLDDVGEEGIALVSEKNEKPVENTADEDTDYDPFDFRIDEIMSAPQKATLHLDEAEDDIPAEVEKIAAENKEEAVEEIAPLLAKKEEPGVIKHTLEDLRELESRLQIKKPAQQETPKKPEEPVFSIDTEEEEELLHFEVKQVELSMQNDETEVEQDLENNPISPSSRKKILERKQRLEQFQYKFKPRMAELLEREPAYKRQGLDIGAGQYSSTNAHSKMTLSGEGDQTEIKTNNSFLHDNVD